MNTSAAIPELTAHDEADLLIGDVGRLSGLSIDTLRYYDRAGLLGAVHRGLPPLRPAGHPRHDPRRARQHLTGGASLGSVGSTYIRKVRTASPATAVQIAEKIAGVHRIVAHVGSAHTDAELTSRAIPPSFGLGRPVSGSGRTTEAASGAARAPERSCAWSAGQPCELRVPGSAFAVAG
jgi:MerR family regulatory protein